VRAAWPEWKLAAAVKGADIALRVPMLRDFFVEKLVHSLNTSYDVNEDDADRLAHVRWLGPHLEAFRRICHVPCCRPAKNMAEGYLDGEIARTIDDVAARWEEMSAKLPPAPGQRPTGVYENQPAGSATR
jgi:hypothetical protein